MSLKDDLERIMAMTAEERAKGHVVSQTVHMPDMSRGVTLRNPSSSAKAPVHDETSAEYWRSRYNELSHNLESWGVIEIMVRNPAVNEYVAYLKRALTDRNPSPSKDNMT